MTVINLHEIDVAEAPQSEWDSNGEGLPFRHRRPPWLRVRAPWGANYTDLRGLMRREELHTVCEEANCPNIGECWGHGTATFLLLGEVCTRSCGFCNIKTGRPEVLDLMEPERVAQSIKRMGINHAVITSVNRDELPDGGAFIFARTIRRSKELAPEVSVEVLIPDFLGDRDALQKVMDAKPEILNHNVETVPRLYREVRPQAVYERSLRIIQWAKEMDPTALTKSGMMVGLGEEWDEILAVMDDLVDHGCDILTIGQYLRPTESHLPIVRYYTPEEFEKLEEAGYAAGFRWVESGPLVRSSYRAERQVAALSGRAPEGVAGLAE